MAARKLHFSFSSPYVGKVSRNEHVGPHDNCTIIFEAVGCFSKQFFVTPQVNQREEKKANITNQMPQKD
ncbi:hypothetical protein ABFA07_007885 [Porites harrisoni]